MKLLKKPCELNRCMLCTTCLPEWIPAIAAHRTTYRVEKGELLFKEGDVVNGIYFIYSGTVKVHKRWGADKELIVRFAKDGHIVGHRGLGADDVFPVSATAIETTIVCFLQKQFFISSLKANAQLLFELMMFFATELKESERNMRNLAHMPVKGRIASALLNLEQKFGRDDEQAIDLQITRQDLASYVGTSYETLFRMLNELSETGAIKLIDRKIAISNRQLLDSLVADVKVE